VLERLVAVAPDAGVHLQLGDLYAHELQDYARADQQYEAYLALSPHGARADQLRAQLLHSTSGERPIRVKPPTKQAMP
jgi:hypothetical protein